MPDTKITALAAITTVDPAADVLPIVDISDTSMAASGTTKKITSNQILGAGGTATLASATITGDLGVGTASPSQKLEIATATANTRLRINSTSVVATEYFRSGTGLWLVGSDSTNAFKIARGSNFGGSADYFSIGSATADCTWFDAAGGTRMTLNANGLGIGVTPSAWNTVKALQISNGSIYSTTTDSGFQQNAFYQSGWKYVANGLASQVMLDGAIIKFQNATNNTLGAGAALTWNPAMTLDASGNLLVGTTATHLSAHSAFQNNASGQVTFRNTSTTAGRYFNIGMNSGSSMLVVNDAGTGVYLDYGTTSWASTSDERLKDIIEPISNAVAKVGSLRSVIGKFKTDSDGTRRSFLIAQDVQSILPEAVDTNNADALGVRYTEVIPLLVAAIKELTAEVNALKNA